MRIWITTFELFVKLSRCSWAFRERERGGYWTPLYKVASPALHCCQVLAKIFRQFHHKIPQFNKKFVYFSGFLLLCNKLYWELKEVLFALFPLNKFVFNLPNLKLFSRCKLVFCCGHHWAYCIFIININLKNNNAISAKIPLQFLAVENFFYRYI
jgi:hypothetical protein